MTKAIVQFKSEQDLKQVLATEYMKQIENLFGDKDRALEFLTNVVASVQRNPKLLECAPETLLNSFMVMASLKLMPSGVSGEAFVLPYNVKGNMVAQFQLGYQGLVTLLYRAGVKSIVAEIVRAEDEFKLENGKVKHSVDIFAKRGAPTAAYVILTLPTGDSIDKVMTKAEILDIAEKFSKSYKGFGPWSEGQDPQLWMWRKTVLKQAAKLAPKNPELNQAIAEDNRDSVIGDRQEARAALPEAREPDMKLVEVWRGNIKGVRNAEELSSVWADCPADIKLKLREEMEDVRAMIITEAKDIQ